jgi:hypothetical protein
MALAGARIPCDAHRMNDHNQAFLARLPWRTGRRVGRTIYAQVSGKANSVDVLIGLMDTVELADEVVASHNALLVMHPPGGERT